MAVRLNKYLASCGLGSRRACDTIIDGGTIRVNGQPAQKGQRVDPLHDRVTRAGTVLHPPKEYSYIACYKPRDVIVSARDPHNDRTIYTFLDEKEVPSRGLKYVGRLDKDSEGLLLLTDNGDLIHALTHPKFQIKKEYDVLLSQKLTETAEKLLVTAGIAVEGELLRAGSVRPIQEDPRGWWYRFILYEGKNREIRRMAAFFDTQVLRLIRRQFATITLQGLKYGDVRTLSQREVTGLLRKAGMKA
ncbi:MAG: pseudouridine synthase [Fibrobacterota bacterium]